MFRRHSASPTDILNHLIGTLVGRPDLILDESEDENALATQLLTNIKQAYASEHDTTIALTEDIFYRLYRGTLSLDETTQAIMFLKTHLTKREINNTNDAVQAFYHLINSNHSLGRQLASDLASAADAIKKPQQGVYQSNAVVELDDRDKELLERYNRLVELHLFKCTLLASTPSNAEFAETTLSVLTQATIQQLAADENSESLQQQGAEKFQQLRQALIDEIVAHYQTLSPFAEATNTELMAQATITADQLLQDIDNETPPTEETHDMRRIADTLYAEFEKEMQLLLESNTVASAVTAIFNHPERRDSTDLTTKIIKIVGQLSAQCRTPIEIYNFVVAELFPAYASMPLLDTESNSRFAVTAMYDAVTATEKAFANETIDTQINNFITGQSDLAAPIKAVLTTHLQKSLHQNIFTYNTLLAHTQLLHSELVALENTVENNILASTRYNDIANTFVSEYDFAEVSETVASLAQTPPKQHYTDVENRVITFLDYQMQASQGAKTPPRLSLYARIILGIIANDVSPPAEKATLLHILSQLIIDNLIDDHCDDSMIIELDNYLDTLNSESTKTLCVHLIKALYEMRFRTENISQNQSFLFQKNQIVTPPPAASSKQNVSQKQPVISKKIKATLQNRLAKARANIHNRDEKATAAEEARQQEREQREEQAVAAETARQKKVEEQIEARQQQKEQRAQLLAAQQAEQDAKREHEEKIAEQLAREAALQEQKEFAEFQALNPADATSNFLFCLQNLSNMGEINLAREISNSLFDEEEKEEFYRDAADSTSTTDSVASHSSAESSSDVSTASTNDTPLSAEPSNTLSTVTTLPSAETASPPFASASPAATTRSVVTTTPTNPTTKVTPTSRENLSILAGEIILPPPPARATTSSSSSSRSAAPSVSIAPLMQTSPASTSSSSASSSSAASSSSSSSSGSVPYASIAPPSEKSPASKSSSSSSSSSSSLMPTPSLLPVKHSVKTPSSLFRSATSSSAAAPVEVKRSATSSSTASRTSATTSTKRSRMYVTPPTFAPITNAQALHDRMHEYAMQILNQHNNKNNSTALNELAKKITTTYQEKINALNNIIPLLIEASPKLNVNEYVSLLARLYIQPSLKNVEKNFLDLYKLQAILSKIAKPHLKKHAGLATAMTALENYTLENNLLMELAKSKDCFTIMQEGSQTEQALAKKIIQGNTTAKSNEPFESVFIQRIQVVNELLTCPHTASPLELATEKFLLNLPPLLSAHIEATKLLSNAKGQAITKNTQRDIEQANTAVTATKAAMVNAFTSLIATIMLSSHAARTVPVTTLEIQNRSNAFVANFMENIPSSHLQQIKYMALTVLMNIEHFYQQANLHQDLHFQPIFDQYYAEIWNINTSLSDSDSKKQSIIDSLNNLFGALGHDIEATINLDDLIDVKQSHQEDQRLRLLQASMAYQFSLKKLQNHMQLRTDHASSKAAAAIKDVTSALQLCMQEILRIDVKHPACETMLKEQQETLARKTVEWQKQLHDNVNAAGSIAPTRGAGRLGLLSGEKQLHAIEQRRQILIDAFKPKRP